VYDELGNKYDIPSYCLSNPVNLVKADSVAPPATTPDKTDEPATQPPADSPPVADLKIKVRLSTNQQLSWAGPPTSDVATLKLFVQEKEGIAPERQRWLFGGQLLPDSQTLAAAKVPADSVVQVMVRPEDTEP